ncbi:MAG: hypothetical protein ACTSU5_00335 [Promethearchaeota archaeon]
MVKIKLRKKKYTGVKICPRCMSPDLRQTFNVSGWATSEMYTCKNCGYTGAFYIEVDPDEVQQGTLLDAKREILKKEDLPEKSEEEDEE